MTISQNCEANEDDLLQALAQISVAEMPEGLAKVFGMPELFEPVLLLLQPSDLLSAQRVSRHWRAFITASAALQKALFLKPDYRSSPCPNPYLRDKFPTFYDVPDLPDTIFVDRLPWLRWRDNSLSLSYENLARWQAKSTPTIVDFGERDRLLRKGASWRNMLTHQPPVTLLEVRRWRYHEPGPCISHGCREDPDESQRGTLMRFPEGLHAGELFDMLVQYYATDMEAWSVELRTEHSNGRHSPYAGRFCTSGKFVHPILGRPDDLVGDPGMYMMMLNRLKVEGDIGPFWLNPYQQRRKLSLLSTLRQYRCGLPLEEHSVGLQTSDVSTSDGA